MTKKDFKEECWILYGFRVEYKSKKYFFGFQKYHTRGTASEVKMDYETASNPYTIGWYHTHPGVKSIIPSSTDNSTMRSWVKSMYKSYLCGIRCGDNSACYCYYLGGVDKEKVTIVKKNKILIRFFGSFFLGNI